MVIVGINKYPNMAVKTLNKGIITVIQGSIHIGLRILNKRLSKRLLWHNEKDIPIFMMIPISKHNYIFGLFDVIDNDNKMIVVSMINDNDSTTNN